MKSHFQHRTLCFLLFLLPILALSQEAGTVAATGDAVSSTGSMTWSQILSYGGIVLKIIMGVSVLTIAYVLWLFGALRTKAAVPADLTQEVSDCLHEGNFDKAGSACEGNSSAYANIVRRALTFIRTVPDCDPTLLRDVIAGEGSAQAAILLGYPQRLSYAISIAPMLGLLGTVIGMLQSFISIAGDVAAAKPVQLAQGMSQAIITTVAGLIVAILASLFQAWFNVRAERAVTSLSEASDSLFTDLLTHKPAR